MKILEQGFTSSYEVIKINTPKPMKSGVMNNTPYPAKVQIRTSLLYTIDDEDLGEIEKEDKLEFRIICANDAEMANLYKHIITLKNNGVVLKLSGTLPRSVDKQEDLRVVCFDTPSDIIKKYPLPKK